MCECTGMTLTINQPPNPQSRLSVFIRRTLLACGVLVVLVLAGWWLVWSYAASRYEAVLDDLISSVRGEGYQVTFDDRSHFGFPRRVALRFSNLRWRSSNGIVFHADSIDISSAFWDWDEFKAHFKNGATLEAVLDDGGAALHLSGGNGTAHVVLNADRQWKVAQLVLEDSKLGRAPDTLFTAERLTLDAERPDMPVKSNKESGLTLDGAAQGITVPDAMAASFGARMDAFSIAMRVMGYVPDVRQRDAVEKWNKESGVVELSRFDMDWGVLHLKARGTVGFDDDLQPEGAFVAAVSAPEPVLKVLMDGGYIAARQAGMLNSALGLFAKSSQNSAADTGIELPIAVQLGGLFLGPVRVFAFPPIEWPTKP